jgi:hypothetical protein
MTDDDKRQRRYAITLTTGPATSEEGSRKLRGLLKQALRVFGLRCVEATEITQEEKTK